MLLHGKGIETRHTNNEREPRNDANYTKVTKVHPYPKTRGTQKYSGERKRGNGLLRGAPVQGFESENVIDFE